MNIPAESLSDISSWTHEQLADHYAVPGDCFRSNLVLSLDGRFADRAGSSRGLSSEGDLRVLRTLRALSDVVVVGGTTARQEGYVPGRLHPDVAAFAARPPRLAVVSRTLDFDAGGPLYSGASAPIVMTDAHALSSASADERSWLQASAEVLVAPGEITGEWVRGALAEIGLTRAVVEGGPAIQHLFLADESLDEVDVTLSPVVVGFGPETAAFGPTGARFSPVAAACSAGSVFLRLRCLHS